MKEKEPKANFGKPIQIHDGEVDRWPLRKDGKAVGFSICCDCGLVHKEEYQARKRYVRVRVWRDEEQTDKQRKKHNYKCKPKSAGKTR